MKTTRQADRLTGDYVDTMLWADRFAPRVTARFRKDLRKLLDLDRRSTAVKSLVMGEIYGVVFPRFFDSLERKIHYLRRERAAASGSCA